ncbi:MAG: hypothetical protein C0490_05775, partial [Marivirga sp.]|nr:hypothetical protein [Marivirga sp.]
MKGGKFDGHTGRPDSGNQRHLGIIVCGLSVFFILTGITTGTLFAQSTSSKSWSAKIKGIGLFSSPRVTDLNGDGVGDIIFGAGREEFKACDSAVIALNGVNGEMLWRVPSIDHVFCSAMLKDITGDKTDDIFIGGRSSQFMAINGKTGEIIWKFDGKKGKVKWFNFYTGQFIKDQDNDGVEDILISNGGNVLAQPFDTKNRYPGNLVVISAKTGKLLAQAPVPDGKEIYISVIALPTSDGKDYKVIFGTGGETIGGNLYATTLSDVVKGDLSKAKLLDSSPNKGYVGPPIWVDINNDSVLDIVANAVEGKLIAFDGNTYKPLWSVKMPETEAYSSVAPGYFTGEDNVPDFFVTYAVGQWPDLGWSSQFMVNGASGRIEYLDSLGSYQTSTPVVFDVNGDGVDEALLNVNIVSYDFLDRATFQNIMVLIDFKTKEALQLTKGNPGSNISSTPWIGDMDNDGMLDIVYCHGTNIKKTYSFQGLQINRIATEIPIKSE